MNFHTLKKTINNKKKMGYLLNVYEDTINPGEAKLITLKSSLMNDNISAVTENDLLMQKGFELESSIINLNKREWDLVVKNNAG